MGTIIGDYIIGTTIEIHSPIPYLVPDSLGLRVFVEETTKYKR